MHEFRNFAETSVELGEGLTAVVGANGEGKSNLLESIAYLATLRSFRGAPNEALVRSGANSAVVRAETERQGRSLLVEAELNLRGRNRAFINRQRLQRSRELLGALAATVFSPDDLSLVKAGPAGRREYLDDLMVALAPNRDALRLELERVLRQRNTLLRQSTGRRDEDLISTLEVWDAKLAETGTAMAAIRNEMSSALAPLVSQSYRDLSDAPDQVVLTYKPSWGSIPLAEALLEHRETDLRRGVTSVGPHRDEIDLWLNGMPARTHASQGEQRTLALALRLASHTLITQTLGSPPVLLLDDVFSELDVERADALVACMPPGQALLTTAGPLPVGRSADVVLRVESGTIIGG